MNYQKRKRESMKNLELPKLFNKNALILAALALLVNFIFLYFNYDNNKFCPGFMAQHKEVAQSVYRYNSIKVGPLKDGRPTKYRSYSDTPAYGLLMGLLWKVTGSENLLYMKLFQVLLFVFFMFLFYQIAFMIFASAIPAIISCIALLFFFPMLFLNVQIAKDGLVYYAGVILLYTILKYLIFKPSFLYLATGSTCFALFQWFRPSLIFTTLLFSLVIVFFYMLLAKYNLKTIALSFLCLILPNILVFWIPFASYNKAAYGHAIIMPKGYNLLSGLGEFPNKWGYELGEGWIVPHLQKHHNYQGSDGYESEKKAEEVFWQRFHENPCHFFSSVLKRIPRIFFPGLLWFNYQDNVELYTLYATGTPIKDIFKMLLRSPSIIFDFVARHIYIGLYLLIAYLGLLLALIRKKWLFIFLVYFGTIVPSYSVIISHTEHRYLIPSYAFYALFVGYFIYETALKRKRL
jgi:hypothetical protein